MLIVQLNNGSNTEGTVIAHALYMDEALRYIYSGVDGTEIPGRRIWSGVAPVGSKVSAWVPTPEEVKAQFLLLKSGVKNSSVDEIRAAAARL